MLKEFKDFAMKGNVVDLATGVIIGAAFGKIVSSLVSDIIMPVLSLITGKINFENLFIAFSKDKYATIEEAHKANVTTLNYGLFITSVVDFLIIAFAIFIIIKQIERFKPKKVVQSGTKTCPFCQSSINIKAVKCPFCTSSVE